MTDPKSESGGNGTVKDEELAEKAGGEMKMDIEIVDLSQFQGWQEMPSSRGRTFGYVRELETLRAKKGLGIPYDPTNKDNEKAAKALANALRGKVHRESLGTVERLRDVAGKLNGKNVRVIRLKFTPA